MEWIKCWPGDNTLTGLNKGPTLEQLDRIFWRILNYQLDIRPKFPAL